MHDIKWLKQSTITKSIVRRHELVVVVMTTLFCSSDDGKGKMWKKASRRGFTVGQTDGGMQLHSVMRLSVGGPLNSRGRPLYYGLSGGAGLSWWRAKRRLRRRRRPLFYDVQSDIPTNSSICLATIDSRRCRLCLRRRPLSHRFALQRVATSATAY